MTVVFPELYYTAEVKKFEKRLYIRILEKGILYYTPPDFIYTKINARYKLEKLANRMNETPFKNWFDLIVEFESSGYKEKSY
jgi:hypothetical protein